MRIAFITAGAAGMYCGSCMRDNTLARALMARGHDVVLVPTYTPTRTDEENVSRHRVFLGGINVYLQHKLALFRHTPWVIDRMLDAPALLNWAAGFAIKTDAQELGALTVSVLRGDEGADHKEFEKLVRWLADEVRPDVVDLSNGLLLGLAAPLRRRLGVPVLCTLSGEDLFLDQLPEPWRGRALALLRRLVADADGFITFSHYYAGFMADFLGIPAEKLFQVPLGIGLDGYGSSDAPDSVDRDGARTIGYLARICPEKGLHVLCEAFRILRAQPRHAGCRLRIAGYLGARDRPYWDDLERRLIAWGLYEAVDFVGEVDRAGKIRFLRSLDIFSVPTVYRECKGLPVLESLASRVPVVQPWHGSFTELVNATQGGLLVPPNDPQALADAVAQLLENEPLRNELGRRGRDAVERQFSADCMADGTLAVYHHFVNSPSHAVDRNGSDGETISILKE
jgi:glycosyltransferase involved in cell wall biosynthesis